MGDQHGGAARHHPAQRVVDLRLDAGVHRGGRVVQHQQPGVGEDRAGQGDALALAAGEGQAVLADHGVVAVRQRGDEVVGLRGPRGGVQLLVGGVRAAVADVGAEGVREQEAVLRHQSDERPQGVQGQLAHVVAADPHGARRHVVEAGQQQRDGGLARPGGAHHGERLAGRDAQGEVLEHRPLRVVAEADRVELDARLGVRRQFRGVRCLGYQRPGVDQLVDPLDPGPRLLAHGEHHGEHPHRAGELGEIGREGDEGAQADLAAHRHPAAERQHRDLAEGRHGLQRRVVAGVEAHGPHPGGEQAAADVPELGLLLGLLAEALDDAHPGDRAVHDTGHGRRLPLRVPGGREQPGAAAVGQEPQGGRDGQRDHRQQRREHRHDDQRDDEHQQVADHHRQHEEESLDELEVAGGPPDDLPGVQLVLPRPVQPDDRVEHRGAQVVLDVQGEPPTVVAPHIGHQVDGDGRGDQHGRPGGQRLGVPDDHVIDDQPGYQRYQRGDAHPGERRPQREQHVAPIPPALGADAPQPALFHPTRLPLRPLP